MSDFGNWRYPIAQKDHTCEWCGEKIPKGEKHLYYTGVWENEWQNYRMHLECHDYGCQTETIQDGFTPFENERPEKQIEVSAQ